MERWRALPKGGTQKSEASQRVGFSGSRSTDFTMRGGEKRKSNTLREGRYLNAMDGSGLPLAVHLTRASEPTGTDTLVTSSTSGLMSTTTLTDRSIRPAALLATHLNSPLSSRLILFRLSTPVALFTVYRSVPSLRSRCSGIWIHVTFGSGLPLAAHRTLAISPSTTSSCDTWSGANVGGMCTCVRTQRRSVNVVRVFRRPPRHDAAGFPDKGRMVLGVANTLVVVFAYTPLVFGKGQGWWGWMDEKPLFRVLLEFVYFATWVGFRPTDHSRIVRPALRADFYRFSSRSGCQNRTKNYGLYLVTQ